jgi:hypothetical protein
VQVSSGPLAQAASRQAETNPPGPRFPTIPARRPPHCPFVHRAEDFESAFVALSFCSGESVHGRSSPGVCGRTGLPERIRPALIILHTCENEEQV